MTARAIGDLLSGTSTKSYAASPVWKGSTNRTVRFHPLADDPRSSRRLKARLWHNARRFERQTRREANHQDGKIGRNGLLVFHALIFDFLNDATGALYPSYASIARAAGVSVSSVYRGLMKLRAAGLLTWIQRCAGGVGDSGRWERHQESNAYAVLSTANWKGFAGDDPPPPTPDAYGAPSPIVTGLAAARDVRAAGGGAEAMAAELERSSDRGSLGDAAARLFRAIRRNTP